MAKALTESRRTRYTRQAMSDALIDLLRDHPLSSISVTALCERADVNRSTFYAHYDAIADLLQDIEDDTMAWVTGALDRITARPDPSAIEDDIARICRYIADNRRHLQVLMSQKAGIDFPERLLGLVYGRSVIAERMGAGSLGDSEADRRMHFVVSGSIGLIRHWMDTDLGDPPEAVAHTIFTMALPTIIPLTASAAAPAASAAH
ncbi:TetR family transcriptional regulator [Bifidobacterium sp. DSM 109958]|uniref:TetR family transcriptional regulator n=1 Tax=Bifidobacterium moraviense TaxID=2675323 RepID=A0A7Y0F2G9_9BIFI|nr:TetR-like C-terminal domain-containing protein [Bifidobacterium sp. DSM 109958]NMN00809.1 TetR family transcriptional regulator [Bifidobacterium sp. DSM 109958]